MTRALVLQNRQRTRALALPLLRRLTRHVLERELGVADYELGFHFVEPEEMARINQQFLQHEGSTDVITFDHSDVVSGVPPDVEDWRPAARNPLANHPESQTISRSRRRAGRHSSTAGGAPAATAPLHGEIFISVADAVKQAREFRTTWQAEVARYIIHALLHLRGHDDLQPAQRKVMKREESRLLKQVAVSFPIAALCRRNPQSPIPKPQSSISRG